MFRVRLEFTLASDSSGVREKGLAIRVFRMYEIIPTLDLYFVNSPFFPPNGGSGGRSVGHPDFAG